MYCLIRSLLFKLEAEQAHDLVLALLSKAPWLVAKNSYQNSVALMGLKFPNRLGLAAGLDKNGVATLAFDRMGFGFIELGTVTPRPQSGNPKPRLFRITQQRALINRMGFNNEGVDALVQRVAQVRNNIDAIIGINIGKNKNTSNETAHLDYRHALETAYDCADYITINLSSPNTEGLRQLQYGQMLTTLLSDLKSTQTLLYQQRQRYVPLLVKISPDNDGDTLEQILATIDKLKIDGIIATNTTIDKQAVLHLPHGNEEGGLSGAPLTAKADQILRDIRRQLPDIALIASGGVMTAAEMQNKLDAGADLVQLYTGFIYSGQKLIAQCFEQLQQSSGARK